MLRSLRILVPVVAASGLALVATAPAQAVPKPVGTKPTKVVIVVVDALSKEIVDKYHMANVQRLMADYVDTPRSYLGHVGSVTVVSHNVITSGLLPKHMGWSDDGWKDTTGLLGGTNPYYVPSSWSKDQMFAVQSAVGKRRLPDYLHAADPTAKVVAISPKRYAAWAYGGPTADSIITFSSTKTCNGVKAWRAPDGVNVPAYISQNCGRFWVNSNATNFHYDTWQLPASLYPLDGDRYVTGHDEEHPGGDVWATDAALAVMDHEKWSGIFLTLPGVDKAAHMWGSVDDKECAGRLVCDPMTHMQQAAATADAQVGRVMDKLRATGQLDNTLVVLTADHGSVPGEKFYGTTDPAVDYGYYNWYYGTYANDGPYLNPPAALKPLIDTGNVAISYSDSMLRVWLKDTSPAKKAQAAATMATLPGVTASWSRNGDHYDLASKVNRALMTHPTENAWFAQHAQELVDTEAAAYGPDIIGTLADDTTYSVAGDHGGTQQRTQQIPIVFAGANLSRVDLQAPVRSVDIMPTVLSAMGITADPGLDGTAYVLPTRPTR